jgi:hypothetical protein
VASDLRKYSPQNRDDVLRLVALRREKLADLFLDYIAGKSFNVFQNSRLARALPTTNRGFFFFHDELIAAMQSATGWSLPRVFQMRVAAYRREITDQQREDFVAATDLQSFELLQFWGDKTFCKSHLVGWWSALAVTASCKIRNPSAWSAVIKDWEETHKLAWNNFGVIHHQAKLFTP